MVKSFILSKKKLIYTNCINLGSFPKKCNMYTSSYSLKYVKQILGLLQGFAFSAT